MSDLIQARTLKGFRDYPPELMIPRERLLEQARKVYRSYGYAPIDTPALEYTEILLGKGGDETDKELYRFKDHGDRDIAFGAAQNLVCCYSQLLPSAKSISRSRKMRNIRSRRLKRGRTCVRAMECTEAG